MACSAKPSLDTIRFEFSVYAFFADPLLFMYSNLHDFLKSIFTCWVIYDFLQCVQNIPDLFQVGCRMSASSGLRSCYNHLLV